MHLGCGSRSSEADDDDPDLEDDWPAIEAVARSSGMSEASEARESATMETAWISEVLCGNLMTQPVQNARLPTHHAAGCVKMSMVDFPNLEQPNPKQPNLTFRSRRR